MTSARTAATLQRLESRAQAQAWTFALRTERLRVAARACDAAIWSADADIRRACLWPSFLCAMLSAFRDSHAEQAAFLRREAIAAFADAELARDGQRHWASLRRVLERRAERYTRASLGHDRPRA